jgi:predicted PurR-regulated permease PerM
MTRPKGDPENRFNVQNMLFFGVFVFLFFLVSRIFFPFFTVILWSGMLYLLFAPLFNKCAGRAEPKGLPGRMRRRLFAGLFAFLAVLVIIVPLAFLIFKAAGQFSSLISWFMNIMEEHPYLVSIDPSSPLASAIKDLTGGSLDLSNIDVKAELSAILMKSSSRLFGYSTAILRNLGRFLITIAFMVFSLYFFFLDGEYLIKLLIRAVPIDPLYMKHFMKKVRDTARHLIRGYFLVALYQCIVAYLLFIAFHVRGSLLLAILVFICSFIPMVGAATIWLPASILKIVQGQLVPGIALLILSGTLISVVDNILRPFLLKDRIKIHPLLIFFSILGGLSIFGFNGLLLGPIIIVLFFSALEIFMDLYPNQGQQSKADQAPDEGEDLSGARQE